MAHLAVRRPYKTAKSPLIIAGALALVVIINLKILTFIPLKADSNLRDFASVIDLFVPFAVLPICVAALFIFLAVNLILRRWRNILVGLFAPALLIGLLQNPISLKIFDPWFWYVFTHTDELKAQARPSKVPGLLIGDAVDVSFGIAGLSPAEFRLILIDETGRLSRLQGPKWRYVNEQVLLRPYEWGEVQQVYGGYYLVIGYL